MEIVRLDSDNNTLRIELAPDAKQGDWQTFQEPVFIRVTDDRKITGIDILDASRLLLPETLVRLANPPPKPPRSRLACASIRQCPPNLSARGDYGGPPALPRQGQIPQTDSWLANAAIANRERSPTSVSGSVDASRRRPAG